MLGFLALQPHCLMVMEACAGAHHRGRASHRFDHEVKLMPQVYVKPFVKYPPSLLLFALHRDELHVRAGGSLADLLYVLGVLLPMTVHGARPAANAPAMPSRWKSPPTSSPFGP